MSEFDPTIRAVVHDRLNDKSFDWDPDWAGHYRVYAVSEPDGSVGWDGRILDGWWVKK